MPDWRDGLDVEKLRKHCGHVRANDNGAAKRENAGAERARTPVERWNDMIAEGGGIDDLDQSVYSMCGMNCGDVIGKQWWCDKRMTVSKFVKAMSWRG